MTENLKKQFDEQTSNYISLGISEHGGPCRPLAVPWKSMANAFNMKTPSVNITVEELNDPELWEKLRSYVVVGCYIFAELQDYSFLTRLPNLWDVHIERGKNIRDLEFMRELKEWFMLYIEDAEIPTLEPLFPDGRKERLSSYCIGLVDCKTDDISALIKPEVWLSELVIINKKGANDKERWESVRCLDYSYYEYDPKASS